MKILATVAVVSVMTGLVFMSVRTVHSLRAERLAEQKTVKSEVSRIDFCFEGLNLERHDPSGNLIQQLDATYVEHYEHDNHFTLERPTFTFFHAKEKPWVISAMNGISTNGRELVKLNQNVVVSRERGDYNSKVLVNTKQLRVHANKRTADTDAAVSFLEDANLMRGVGADIDFNQGTIKLASQIQIWYKLNF